MTIGSFSCVYTWNTMVREGSMEPENIWWPRYFQVNILFCFWKLTVQESPCIQKLLKYGEKL